MKQATIIDCDEVNVKVEGLDLDMRRRLVSAFKYDVPYARYLPAVRLGRWDGKVSYFQLGGSTYTNLLPEILPNWNSTTGMLNLMIRETMASHLDSTM